MRDRVLTYAIAVSIAAHLVAVAMVGNTYASRRVAAPVLSRPKFINVDLVNPPKSLQSKPLAAPKVSAPKPQVVPPPPPSQRLATRPAAAQDTPRPGHRAVAVGPRSVSPNPGGRLNTGSRSASGDIDMDPGGSTPVGWVPNNNANSTGQGSGEDPGRGTPEPPKHIDPTPDPTPVTPPPPPPPKMVSVDICSESGMRAGKWCQKKRDKEFAEGSQPTRTCTECKEPFKSSLADRAEPVLTRDARVDVPSSVDEGLSVSVTVSFTITEDGSVSGASVASSSGNKLIDRAAVSAVQKRKYQPAVQGGIPRSVKRSVTFRINT